MTRIEHIEPNNARGATDRPFDFAAGVARLLAFPVLVWTTKFGTWGSRFQTGSAAVGLSWLGVIGIACGRLPRSGDVLHFWVATTTLLVVHRVVGGVRRLGGYECDAEFRGASWLWFGPGPRAERAARCADAVVAFGVGLALFQLGRTPLGAVLVVGALAKLFGEGLDIWAAEARA